MPHDRPIIKRPVVGARHNNLIWKASKQRRWWTHAPKNHLAWVRIQVPLLLKEESANSSIFWVPSASGGEVFIFSSLQSFTGEGNGTPLQYFCLENPMDGGAWWTAVHGVARVGHDRATSLSLFTIMHWRRKWQPTPVFLPGESQGRGSLVGCRLWGRTESDTTEVT